MLITRMNALIIGVLLLGMQLIGRMNDEETLFSVAGEMERAGMFTKAIFEK